MQELSQMARSSFGNLVKAVVDVKRSLLAVDAELHSDLESCLLENGSAQSDLWGVNLYPECAIGSSDFIEYDSMINMRPSQGNRSRGVDSSAMRAKIAEIVAQRVVQ